VSIRTLPFPPTRLITRLALVSLLSVGFIACGDDEEAPNNTADTGMPDMGTPDASEPDADTPDADMPDMDSPDVDMPDMDSPDVDMPDMDSPDAEASLYEQLGGAAAVEAVVGKFLEKVVADERINWFFADTDAANLSRLLQEQICAATGGPCTYTGGTMLEVHEGMAITDAQFDALVEDLLLALDELGVPYSEGLDGSETIDPLLNALLGMRGDIVEDADGDTVLFNQLGGYAAVSAVVDGLLTNVLANEEINWMFANADAADLRQKLIEQVCDATGGFCVYSGLNMVEAHAGMAITTAQFNALVGDFLEALDTLGVEYTADTFDGGLPADTLIQALAGMATDIIEDADGDTVLFNQLGGYAAVQAVIDGLITNVGADARINGFFADTDLDNLNRLLVEQVCEATGGFCVYTGRSMRDSHAGLNIQDADFDALVEDLLAALDTLGVAYTADTFDGGLPADALITTLAGLRTDIVNVPAP
jgi:truncated hemoglobin YjbI